MPPATEQNLLRARRRGAGQNFVLVIHGGAGTMTREGSTPEKRAKYTAALTGALEAGYEALRLGGEAMDAAVAAVAVLEGKLDRTVPSSGEPPITMTFERNGFVSYTGRQTVLSSMPAKVPSST